MWEQISRLKTGDWCCSLIMHRGRPGAGLVDGLAPSIQVGCFHVANALPGQWLSGKASPAPLLAKRSDGIAEAEVCVVSVRFSAAQGPAEQKEHVPGKSTAIPRRIYTSKKSPQQQSKCCQLHLSKCSQQRPFDSREFPFKAVL